MNKEWYDRECCWLDKQISDKKSTILKYIVNVPYLSNEVKEKIKAAFEKTCENTEVTLYSLFFRSLLVYENVTEKQIKQFLDNVPDLSKFTGLAYKRQILPLFLDSKELFFNGDIIITDPSYFFYDKEKWNDEDWEKSNKGKNLEQFGFSQYYSRETIEKEWYCSLYHQKRDKIPFLSNPVGSFKITEGVICVGYLKDVLNYNPDFFLSSVPDSYYTILKGFRGTVQFVVKPYNPNIVDIDSENMYLEVITQGLSTKTLETMNCMSKWEI